MKKLRFLIAILIGSVLHSCSNDAVNTDVDDITNVSSIRESYSLDDIQLVDGTLSFPTMENFNQIIDSISNLSEDEFLKWEVELGFTSLYRIHSQADAELETLKTQEEYYNFKKTYCTPFVFNDKDFTDLSIYIPCSNMVYSKLIPMSGIVYIGGEKKNLIDISSYDEYVRKKNLHSIVTFGVTNSVNYCSSEIRDRKFRASIGMSFAKTAIRVNASKKILWGWKEYTTAYYWKYSPNGPIQYGQDCKSGTDILIINGFANGTKLYMWSRGVDEANLAIMTVQL